MDESERPFDIFNDRYFNQRPVTFSRMRSGAPGCANFSRFSYLPKELRLKIWTWNLRRRRFLRVLLEETTTKERSPWHDDGSEDHAEWGDAFTPTPKHHGAEGVVDVCITFLDASMASVPTLPLVCHEAYEAYIAFYPIRLPSLVRVPYDPDADSESAIESVFETRHTVAYLHPENDIFSLEVRNAPQLIEKNLLPSFLHNLLQHDSSPAFLRFGVRNLCLDLKQLGDARDDDDDDDTRHSRPGTVLLPDVLVSVRTTISHLRNLYLRLTTRHLEPRITSGPLTGSGALPWYNASMPILPLPSWEGFSSHVEPVEGGDTRLEASEDAADLHQVWIGSHIRPSIEVWKDLERAWGVKREEDGRVLRVRALVALAPETNSSMEEFLRREKAEWQLLMDPTSESGALLLPLFEHAQQRFLAGSSSSRFQPTASVEAISPDDWFLRRRERTAAGYWLVEPKVLGGAKSTGYPGKKVIDLREQGKEAIELWLFKRHS